MESIANNIDDKTLLVNEFMGVMNEIDLSVIKEYLEDSYVCTLIELCDDKKDKIENEENLVEVKAAIEAFDKLSKNGIGDDCENEEDYDYEEEEDDDDFLDEEYYNKDEEYED